MPERLIAALEAEGARFYRWIGVDGVSEPVIRLVTSFQTGADEVEPFLALAAHHAREPVAA